MKHNRAFSVLLVLFFVALTSGFVLQTSQQGKTKSQSMHGTKSSYMQTVQSPDNLQWMKAPDVFPAGAQMAVLEGDPSSSKLFTVRLKLPANYEIKPHWHPTDEAVTVISGKLNVGMGDTFSKDNTKPFDTGGFGVMPAKMHHYAWADGETIVQVHAMGPFKMTYVNKQDDPRNASTSKQENGMKNDEMNNSGD